MNILSAAQILNFSFGISETIHRQEDQLPLRNRASAMHFFLGKLLSIAVMTYSYVYHLRNPRPSNLLCTQRINFSMRPQHVCTVYVFSFTQSKPKKRENVHWISVTVQIGDPIVAPPGESCLKMPIIFSNMTGISPLLILWQRKTFGRG